MTCSKFTSSLYHESSRLGSGINGSPGTSTERIKILHVINDLAMGGSEMALYRLLSLTDLDVFDPVVISLREPSTLRGRIEALGVPVLSARMSAPIPGPASIWRLVRLVRKVNPDLMQGWMYHGSLAAQLAGRFSARAVPVIWSIHNCLHSLSQEKRATALVIKLCALLSPRADHIVFVSHANRWQHEAIGYSRKNNSIIPNGFDFFNLASYQEARRSVRAELGLSEDALLIGHVGRFHSSKDHGTFLRAAALLASEQPSAQFVLCGRDVDCNNNALMNLCRELNLTGRMHLLGERRDAQRLIAAFDLLCSSSQAEACPNVIIEAMACGVPCVVTDVGDMPRMIGETGRVVPPVDPNTMAEALKEMIVLGAKGRNALGNAARERVIEKFSLDSVVRQYESRYKDVACRVFRESGVDTLEKLGPALIKAPPTGRTRWSNSLNTREDHVE
jgi:glycosyltransferase involved in cell wall biosynthesis